MRVGQAVGAALADLGVDRVFGVIGSGNYVVTTTMDARGAGFVAARHESAAVCMADGYARVTGRVGVASVHQGPGLTNALTGVAEAAKSRTPLLVLAADTPAAAVHSNFRVDQAAACAAVGAAVERVSTPQSALQDVERAWRRARNHRRTVVLLLPLDVQAAELPWGETFTFLALDLVHRPDVLAVAADDLHVLADVAEVCHCSLSCLLTAQRTRRQS